MRLIFGVIFFKDAKIHIYIYHPSEKQCQFYRSEAHLDGVACLEGNTGQPCSHGGQEDRSVGGFFLITICLSA